MKQVYFALFNFCDAIRKPDKVRKFAIPQILVLLQSQLVQAQWTRMASANRDRSEVTNVVYQNKFYTFMGFGDFPNIENSNEVYDPASNTWAMLAPMPDGKAVTHQGVVLVDGQVWHIGGRIGRHPGPLTNEVWIYDIENDNWLPGPALKDPVTGEAWLWGGGGSALLGRTLHVFGGFVNSACDSDQSSYHLTLDVDAWREDPIQTTWENKRAAMPLPRNHFSTVVLEGKIYVLGGQFGHDCSGGDDQPFSHVYNPVLDTWAPIADMPGPRSHAESSTFPLDGKIYVVAGQGENSDNQDRVTIYTPGANSGLGSWQDAPEYVLPNIFEGMAAKVVGEKFIISHGGIGSSNNTQRKLYTAPINRNLSFSLGFLEKCVTHTVAPGGLVEFKNYLFAREGKKAYILEANVPWLRLTHNKEGVTDPAAMEVKGTINADGLAPGTYAAIITARGTGNGLGYTEASFCIDLTVTTSVDSPLPQITKKLLNVGGGAYVDAMGQEWSADAYASGGEVSSKSFGVEGTSDDLLYLQYRYASGSSSSQPGEPFSYNVPVAGKGAYTVRLHFLEPVFKRSGSRRFHVDVEGQRVLSDFDIYAGYGRGMAAVLTFEGVQVSDGVLDIDFTSVVNNAIISAIEVSQVLSASAVTTLHTSSETISQKSIMIYPNPTTGGILIMQGDGFGPNEALSVSVRDITGRKVYSAILKADISGSFQEAMKFYTPLPAGVYLIEATGAETRQQFKLVVQ